MAGAKQYEVRLDSKTGNINVKIPNNSDTNLLTSIIAQQGKIEIVDSEDGEIFLTREDIKTGVLASSASSSGTSIYIQLQFKKEAKQKLEDMSRAYLEGETYPVEETTVEETTEEEVV